MIKNLHQTHLQLNFASPIIAPLYAQPLILAILVGFPELQQ